jgi:carbonic anhydrase
MIGNERTLLITCMECCFDIEQHISGQVFRYTSPGNWVNEEDVYQRDSISSFVDFKKCSKIIVVGHDDCRVLDFALGENSLKRLKSELTQVLTSNHTRYLSTATRHQLLVEQNVITQCVKLRSYTAIAGKVADGDLTIVGLVMAGDGGYRKVFANGIAYNLTISRN